MTYRFVPELELVDWAWRLGSSLLLLATLLFCFLALRRRCSLIRFVLVCLSVLPAFALSIFQWVGKPAVVFDARAVRLETPVTVTRISLSPQNRVIVDGESIWLVGEREAALLSAACDYRIGDLVVGAKYVADEFAARSREVSVTASLAEPAVEVNSKHR